MRNTWVCFGFPCLVFLFFLPSFLNRWLFLFGVKHNAVNLKKKWQFHLIQLSTWNRPKPKRFFSPLSVQFYAQLLCFWPFSKMHIQSWIFLIPYLNYPNLSGMQNRSGNFATTGYHLISFLVFLFPFRLKTLQGLLLLSSFSTFQFQVDF